MLGHRPMRCHRPLFVLAVAMILAPVVAHAQDPDPVFYACISRDVSPPTMLGERSALNLGGVTHSLQNCAKFCRNGRIPPGAETSRGHPFNFQPPYRFATLNNGRWCYCGPEPPKGATIDRGACLGKMNCLKNLEGNCYINTEPDHMVIDLDPPAGATATGGGGAAAPGGGSAPTTQPPSPGANRRPNPPTVQPGAWDPPFPLQYEGAYQMSWQNNGDPDGDVLTFGVIIFQYDWTGSRWMQMPGIRDQYGTYGMAWLPEDNYTFTTQNGLSPRTHYAWMVFACDLGKGPAALCSWSSWGLFRTQ